MKYNVKQDETDSSVTPADRYFVDIPGATKSKNALPLEEDFGANLDLSTYFKVENAVSFTPYYTESKHIHGIAIRFGRAYVGLAEMSTLNWRGRERFIWEVVIRRAVASIKDPTIRATVELISKTVDWKNYELYN